MGENVTELKSGFIQWSPEVAWWLGITYGDGNVYQTKRDNRVSVCGSLSTVTKWLALIGPHKVAQEFKSSPGTYQGYLDSKHLVEWFKATLGLCGPKAATLAWPECVPEELKVHFLRGLWDSDGSLSVWDRRAAGGGGNPQRKAGFSSASLAFVERVKAELVGLCSLPPIVTCTNTTKLGTWYSFSYGGSSAQRVADVLYKGCPPHLVNDDRLAVYERFNELERLSQLPCPCGLDQSHEGLCQQCWWNKHGRKTGPGTACSCGKPVLALQMCSACYNRKRRQTRGA
jgi:hypothetical protein